MTGTRVLVIDDSRAMRLMLGEQLRNLGCRVTEAEHGKAGLDQLTSGLARPDLILVDWNMPVMNGLEFIQAVRGDSRFDGTCMLVVTSETEQEQVVSALSAGADEYLMKPFTADALATKLSMLGLGMQ